MIMRSHTMEAWDCDDNQFSMQVTVLLKNKIKIYQ